MATRIGIVQCGTAHIAQLIYRLSTIQKKPNGSRVTPHGCNMEKMISIGVNVRHRVYRGTWILIHIVGQVAILSLDFGYLYLVHSCSH